MPDTSELRLRENVHDSYDWAFVIGGEAELVEIEGCRGETGRWVGGRIVCHFGCEDPDEGGLEDMRGHAPSPEDARRIERGWNCLNDLLELVRDYRELLESEWSGSEGFFVGYAVDVAARIDVILKKATEPVARGSKGNAKGEG